jgi:hypothetical protein
MSRVVLTKKAGWEQPDGSGTERKWARRWYVARDNPLRLTDDVRAARVFHTLDTARAAKRALYLDRLLAARRLPEWL